MLFCEVKRFILWVSWYTIF